MRSHVLLCWLGLLLVRIIEKQTDRTWRSVIREFGKMSIVTYTSSNNLTTQRTRTTILQKNTPNKLDADEPPLILDIEDIQ
jgi:hypothetical protein